MHCCFTVITVLAKSLQQDRLQRGALQTAQLRFIAVDSANPAFTAEGNVLFTKDMRRLVCYAPSRPETEYRVPESVRVLGHYSFRFPSHLERLYLPRGTTVSDNALVFYEGREPEIEYY